MRQTSRATLHDLQVAGLILPPVLTTHDLRRILGLKSTSAVLAMHRREGLPLAKLGRRFVVTRQAFTRWLDERADASPTLSVQGPQ